ncbi:MAG: hypothetical protein H6551_11480 [Chitinophagales bacterium]|nr:hypothetical protein [Chitinophagaceae bacterium]MCB9065748.1 hypothetical protein [Chitinophagales bacterium]
MSNPRFDLVDIAQTLHKRRKMLLIAVIISALLGGLFYVVGQKKYKAEAEYIVSNPLYADRNNLFRTRDTRFVDYFGGDDDIDRILSIANSDTLRNAVLDKLNLWEVYKLDKSNPDDRLEMRERFQKHFKMERTEYTTAKVYYTDTDPDRAAEVVNLAMEICENIFRGYYIKMKDNVAGSIKDRVEEIDASVDENTTEMVKIAKELEGTRDYAAREMLNIKYKKLSAVNDQLIQDRARNVSLLNEFMTGVDSKDRNRYLQVITPATPPLKPAGIGLALTIIGAAFFGFFFIGIYILIVSYYRLLIAEQR